MSAAAQIAIDAVIVGAVDAVLMRLWPFLRPGAVVCAVSAAVAYGAWMLLANPTGASMAAPGPDTRAAADAAVLAGPILAAAAVIAWTLRTRAVLTPATVAAGIVAALAAWLEPIIDVLV
ncbi:hypothetical protein [Nocardia terpenica]|nr:hypothetical protein [Nocardia terpenica]